MSRDRALSFCVIGAGAGLALAVSSWRLLLASSVVWLWVALPGLLRALVQGRDGASAAARGVLGAIASLIGMVTLGCILRTASPALLAVPAALAIPAARRLRSEHWRALRGSLRSAALPVPLSVALLVTFAVLAVPLLSVGRVVGGEHRFLAYFCADLFKHAAHTNALVFGAMPPADPFASGQVLQYYWFQASLPALSVRLAGTTESAISALLVHQLIQSALLLSLLFALARRLGAGPVAAAVAPCLALLAGFDGLAAQLTHRAEGFWQVLQAINVEGEDLTAVFGAPTWLAATSLFRAFLYLPQHLLALLATLAWWYLQNEPEPASGEGADFLLAAALPGLSAFVAPPTLAAVAIYRWWRRRQLGIPLMLGSLCGALLLLAGTGFEWRTDPRVGVAMAAVEARTAWYWLLPQALIAYGPALLLVAVGVRPALRGRPRADVVLLSLVVALAVWLLSEELAQGRFTIEVQLKSSLLVWLALAPCLACTLSALPSMASWRRAVALACLAVQPLTALTLFHDIIAHSVWPWDSKSRARMHVSVPTAEMDALLWMRSSVPAGALVHQSPEPPFVDGGRDAWVPIFAGRRIYASPRGAGAGHKLEDALGISRERAARALWASCRQRGIDTVYVSRSLEAEALAREAVLAADPGAFRKLYANDTVSIWQVRLRGAQ